MRVLIVEDDPLLGDALVAGLKQRGFEPDWVQDGREAQTAMRVEPFAAIILDLGLPGSPDSSSCGPTRAEATRYQCSSSRRAMPCKIGSTAWTAVLTTTWSNRWTSTSSQRGCEHWSGGPRASPRRSARASRGARPGREDR
jgi:CheY-like chemotaxis protein